MQFGEAAREEYWLAHMRTGARPQAWQALDASARRLRASSSALRCQR
jgi:hypothetical protein